MSEARLDQLDLRASDEERDRAAAALGGALAVGRLTSTEYAERLDAVYAARTRGELAPLTRDLPADDGPGRDVTADRALVVARFSKVIRSGRWVAGRHTRLTVRFGALIIIVPPGAHVIDEGGALFAKRAVYGQDRDDDGDGPVIRLTGDARFSKVAVFRAGSGRGASWRHHVEQWRNPR